MTKLESALSEYKSDMEAINEFVEELYEHNFSTFFNNQVELYKRIQSKTHAITDSELSEILVDIPVQLFSMAEVLNHFRLELEVIKMKNKEKRKALLASATEKTITERNESVECQMIDSILLVSAYSTVIKRVENEISFTRELIMGAKKIWDSRRKSENVNPVSEVEPPQLPDYDYPGVPG